MRTKILLTVLPLLLLGLGAVGQQRGIPKVEPDEVICFAMYTVSADTLKLTAQLYPLPENADRTLTLEIEDGGEWKPVAEAAVIEAGWTAPFRVEKWDMSREVRYRVNHMDRAFYTGIVRRDPVDKDDIVVAAFTGNSVRPADGGSFPKTDLVENIQRIEPDLLFFSGDQVYNHNEHYRFWLQFGRDFGDIIRDYPTICIPDDHDVGHPNIWGAGGKKGYDRDGADGGFFKPVAYVNEVQRAQTSHLPDPHDPTPIQRGITVYYTSLTWGGVSFAIIEDRKWKTGPRGFVPQMGPRPDHITTPDYDPAALDLPGAVLLGDRQLDFVRAWAQDWTGAEMKAVLSQTIFAGGAHLHGKYDNRLYADLDANGWPQAGRNRALHEFRKAFAVMIAGDQHLGTVIHHGIDNWNDAGYSFCVPSIANLYLRWWEPLEPGVNREPGAPEYTGEFLDGYGNKVTMLAAANPDKSPRSDDVLTTRSAGFGVARFNKQDRTVTFECWPRNADITDSGTEQYPGWPVTVSQDDNYGAKPFGYLPTLTVEGVRNPVVQVVNETTEEVVYTLRIKGSEFRPKVFEDGNYVVRIGDRADVKELTGLRPGKAGDNGTAKVTF